MTASYDLFVLLDPEVPEERRSAIVEQVKSQLGSGGATLKGDADWGMRRLAYEIDHRREAQYHLFQFQGSADVLTQLDRSLSIEDAVLRHRIIRLPGEAPEQTPGPSEEASRRMGDERPPRDGAREREDEADATAVTSAEAPAPPPATTEEAPSEGEEAAAEGEEAAAEGEEAPAEAPAAPEAAPDESA